MKNVMKDDIENALKNLSAASDPKDNEVLSKIYDGCSSLSDGFAKVSDGDSSLSKGMETLNSGLNTLKNGGSKLTLGMTAFDESLAKLLEGSQTLKTKSSQGIADLTSGIGQLNSGAQSILAQFSSGGASRTTIYDGVNGIAGGSADLAAGLDTYTAGVNTTLYYMISSNPQSANLLTGYKNSLVQLQNAYAKAAKEEKNQYLQQIKVIKNLVLLYSAGSDPKVKNVSQFTAKLESLAKKDETNQTVVSLGSKITDGADTLTKTADKVAEQFSDNGTFKQGMKQLAKGLSRLYNNSDKLTTLNRGIQSLNAAIEKLQASSGKLRKGSEKLEEGIESATEGSDQLLSASKKLIAANERISTGIDKISTGIGTAGQANEVQVMLNKINDDIDHNIADAFSKTFFLAAMVLMFTSFVGLFTDKKKQEI